LNHEDAKDTKADQKQVMVLNRDFAIFVPLWF
jgi:hypothetical protein